MTMKKTYILSLMVLIFLFPEVQGQMTGLKTTATFCPDSVITFKFDAQGDSTLNAKMTYRYNNHLRVIESEKFIREQSLNLWIPNHKDVREYDNQDRRTLWAIYEWDNSAMAYKGWMKETTLFDNQGNKSEYHYYTWDYNLYDWGNRFWDLFDYDNENKLLRRDHLEWNTVSEQWDTASYEIYEYDGSGILQRLTAWEPDEGSGIIYPYDRGDYEYDGSGNVVKITHQIYNPYTELWYWTERHQYEYDALNRKTHWMYSIYDEQGEEWIDKEKDEWEWDDNDSLTLYAYYRIGEDLVTWYPQLKAEMTYNDHGKLINYRGYSGNNDAQWVPTYERRYPYQNDTLLLADSLFQWIEDEQVWEFVDCNNYRYDSLYRLHTDSYYDLTVHTGQYMLHFRDYYFYSASAGVAESHMPAIRVFPNPSTGMVRLQSPAFSRKDVVIEIVDLDGKMFFKEEMRRSREGEINIDIGTLAAGLYFVRIYFENQTIVKKIIKL